MTNLICVLLVEDNLLTCKITKLILERLGCMLDTAKSGGDALSLLDTKRYDLLIVDIGLPDINGIEFIRQVKEKYQIWETPIVILSAHTDEEYQDQAKSAGADGFFVKPLTEEMGEDILQRLGISDKRSSSA